MDNLVIIGAGGVLGAKLVEQALWQMDGQIYAFTHGSIPAIPASESSRVIWHQLELSDPSAVADAIAGVHPDVVINSAAMTNVDACELRRDEAYAANADGPRHLAETCVQLGARLVHVSTDYVFPGDDAQPGPYQEDAQVRPVNYYGWTKLEGERAIEEIGEGRTSWLIVRTALVYGHVPGGRTNFVKWLVGELRSGRRVKIVSDQINTPTVADDLAVALLHLAQGGSEGVIHVTGPDLLTRYEWAKVIASSYGLDDSLIDVISTAALNQPAQRPLRSGLRSLRASEWQSVPLRGVREGLGALDLS
ncbi:MAG: dTDP-4-dehydrorhamnose reductase [Ktedonobacterales bacterium]